MARLAGGLEQAADRGGDVARSSAARFTARLEPRIDPCLRLARAILGDHADAEDVLHDAVVAAWRAWPDLRDETRFDGWFDRILVNRCRDRLRRRRRGPHVVPIVRELESGPLVDPWPRVTDSLAVERAFADLDPEHAVVAALRFYRDLPIDAIAALVGIPEGTVKSRLHHATLRLRAALGAHEAADD